MAKQYDSEEPIRSTETVTHRNNMDNGAEVYAAPQKKSFPWWLLLLGLIPLLLLWNRADDNDDQDERPVAVASASPAYMGSPSPGASPSGTMATDADGTSRTGSAALPPAGGSMSTTPEVNH